MAGGKIIRITGGVDRTITENFTGYYENLTMTAGGENIFTAGNTILGTPKEPERKAGYFVKGWWSSDSEGKEKIKEALIGETVYFHLETRDIPNGKPVFMSLFDDDVKRSEEEIDSNKGSDRIELYPIGISERSNETESKYEFVKNNKIVKKIYLNDYFSKLISEEKDKCIELFFACSYNNQHIELPLSFKDYLKVRERVVVFFIGGAGDKESYYFQGPFNNIKEVKDLFEEKLSNKKYYSGVYLDYSDVYDDIENSVIKNIASFDTNIYIVGHSLGGWNGAHLSQILTDKGYKIQMLITLDPVGEGKIVFIGSRIYRQKPKPKAYFWINILAMPTEPDSSDDIAEFGERWMIITGPNINNNLDINHYNAKKMFTSKLTTGKSAYQYLLESISK